jgi:hypothetical protein
MREKKLVIGFGIEGLTPEEQAELRSPLLVSFNTVPYLSNPTRLDPRESDNDAQRGVFLVKNPYKALIPIFQIPDKSYNPVRLQNPGKFRASTIVIGTPVERLGSHNNGMVRDIKRTVRLPEQSRQDHPTGLQCQ